MEEIINSVTNEAKGEKALEVLYILSYFGTENIETGTFSMLLSNPEELREVFELLNRHSLVTFVQETAVRIDKDVQTQVRAYLRHQNKEEYILKLAIRTISLMLKYESNFYHAMSVFEHTKVFPEKIQLIAESTGMASHVINGLTNGFRNTEAYSFCRNVLEFAKENLGEHHPETLTIQHNMATVLGSDGKYKEALELLLPLYEKDVNFSDQSEVIQTMVTIARSLSESSMYAEALPFYDRLLKNSQVINTDDKTLLTAWHDYALLLNDMDLSDKALKILREVLQKEQQMSSIEDKDKTCLVRSSIAHVLLKEGTFREALEILEEVCSERKVNLGEMHADTLRTQRDMACVLMNQNNYDRALTLLRDVVGKFDQVLGELHPDTLAARANLATTYSLRNELDEAYPMLLDVYEKQREVLGEHQIETLRVKHNIGSVLLKKGKSGEALKVLQEVLVGFRIVFGPKHWETSQLQNEVNMLRLTNLFQNSFSENIHSLSIDGEVDKVESLIKNGEDVNSQDINGRTPLHHAAEFCHVQLAKLLLREGAAYDAKDEQGRTPLQLAYDFEVNELLASTKSLFEAVKEGNISEVQQILQKSFCIADVKDSDGYTPLHWAAFKGHTQILRLLLESGANATLVSNKNNSPLHVATSKGHQEMVKLLVQFFGGNSDFINGKTKIGGNSALHVAAKCGFVDIVKILLEKGAVFDIQNREGKTPLEVAKDHSVCNLLKLVDSLFKGAMNGNSDILNELRDTDPSELLSIQNARNSQNYTLLQVSIKNEHQIMARKLMEIFKNTVESR